jgi:hypothetical protein
MLSHEQVLPQVILRNMLENHGWFSQYSPYQVSFFLPSDYLFPILSVEILIRVVALCYRRRSRKVASNL